ncbi:hypothetical protein B566_EDAN006810 [Ephemera danica]|nr:hypothetical protein B566_EDAN006810 [Ephemera danica]
MASRREALEAILQEKNKELKRLCVAEAELTGVLPPEIPVLPGEPMPTFRRRIGTSFTLPENLINKLKSEEEQAVSALELEYEVQSHITSAALQLASDLTAKKAVRRQRRFEYQQNHRRLQELEARLNQIKLNQNGSQKHRKKPRPSIDGEVDNEPVEKDFHDSSMSSSKSCNHLNGGGGGYLDIPYQSNTMPYSHSHLLSYSHLHSLDSKVLKAGHVGVPHYSLAKLKASTEARGHRHQLQSPQHVHGGGGGSRSITGYLHSCTPRDEVDGRDFSDSHSCHQSTEGRGNRWGRNRFGSLDRKKHMAHSNPCLESLSVEGLDVLQAEAADQRGKELRTNRASYTLEKPKYKDPPAVAVPSVTEDGGPWQKHQVQYTQLSQHSPAAMSGLVAAVTGETLLPGQTYPEHNFGQAVPYDRTLTRTQSLGSVEVANAATLNVANNDTRSIKDMYPSTSYTQQKNYDASLRKLKEKEWYETSLDAPSTSHTSPRPPSVRASANYESKSLDSYSSCSSVLTSGQSPSSNQSTPATESTPHHQHHHLPMTVVQDQSNGDSLSLSSRSKSEASSEFYDSGVPLESPQNHMVVQAGKWQPYWEVTKPFEMSDFYKYSTKFRKKNGLAKPETDMGPTNPEPPHVKVDIPSNHCSGAAMPASPTPSMSPQQKGIYQPLQPMTCHPLEVSSGSAAPPESPSKPVTHLRNKTLSPNTTLNGSLTGPNGESLADAFSSEMLAWYQDKSTVSRSATLV